MGKRGAFKKRDVERAIRSVRDAGVAPAMVEVETKDGTIIRVFSGTESTANATANPWDTVLKGGEDHAPKSKRTS